MARAPFFALALMTAAAAWSPSASAARLALAPQNRVHLGVSLSEVSAIGATGGMDSRLTRVIYVDAGGFVTAVDPVQQTVTEAGDPAGWLELRHAIFVAPGVRIPHRYGEGINWDVTGRAGFAAVWTTDASLDYTLMADPALLAGLEALVRKDKYGMRVSGKAFGYKPFSGIAREELTVVRPHLAVEGVVQW